mgnify:CR=1 FL=1
MADFPFKKPAAAPTAAPAATPAPAAASAPAATETAKAPKEKKLTKKGVERKTPAPAMTPDQVKQVLSLVKDNSYTQIAEIVGITKYQVNRVLMSTKEQLLKAAEGDAAKTEKVKAYIKEYLSRPEDSRPGMGGGRTGGKVKGALDNVVGDILASIG